MNELVCTCAGANGAGYVVRERMWVHAVCERPTIGWLESDDEMAEIARASLHIMQGGPQHNTILPTHELLRGAQGAARWISDYQWTKDTITGSESGKIARVWRYVGEST